jgi:hypothetical protein
MKPHVSQPGPDYWSWRCLRCSGRVDDRALHPGVRLFWRWLKRRP